MMAAPKYSQHTSDEQPHTTTAAAMTPTIRIQVMSDLHLETPRLLPMYGAFAAIPPRAPYLALLGDIGNARDPRLYAWLEAQLQQFDVVFYVLGNHEPYRLDDDDDDDGGGGLAYGRELLPRGRDDDDEPQQEEEEEEVRGGYEDAARAMRRFEHAMEEKRRESAAAAAAAAAARDAQHGDEEGRRRPSMGRFVFMDRRRFDISDDVTVLGCTLFSHITPEQRSTASLFVSDFSSIPSWTVDGHNACHARDLAWLNKQVRALCDTDAAAAASGSATTNSSNSITSDITTSTTSSNATNTTAPTVQDAVSPPRNRRRRRILILTHHSPTSDPRANNPEHLDDPRGVQTAFVTDLRGQPCWRSRGGGGGGSGSAVAAWAFGHTHFNCDFVDEVTGTRVVANQRGYGREDAYDFDAEKVIEI
ncbi:hypothetical protein JDV02_009702 [Purpureocillium takamizusanense]|uniref:Calcineurin-like phosphoesterase domain-containing protein n=1 Tax=Purpureocillium takamizusanense TaxID=2060973 RepID=A0A9Q8QS89_9HYPO|nr:uncharacterized protein JDV02_009702 [Purpureocillium takamizusanense]UNI23911.1 hypothetical protein JDV02_009702 [Purpureocillium takamizusanense]